MTFSHENKEQHAVIQKNPALKIRFQTRDSILTENWAFRVVSTSTEFQPWNCLEVGEKCLGHVFLAAKVAAQ